MSRDVKNLKLSEIENLTIYFLIKRCKINNTLNESILGPYLNKPKIQKMWAKLNIEHEILEFKRIKP